MKLRVTFKTPDVVDYAIKDAIKQVSDDGEEETLPESMRVLLKKYIEYGEYCTLEFDDETETVKVLPN